ncbi:hypothetical protein CAZ05_31725, partial [Pseudomonas aeruginosa]
MMEEPLVFRPTRWARACAPTIVCPWAAGWRWGWSCRRASGLLKRPTIANAYSPVVAVYFQSTSS